MRTTTTRGADAPIGIFDSGVGGVTVARAVLDQFPNESVRYIRDTVHGPYGSYGPLPSAAVRRHSLVVMDGLLATGDPESFARLGRRFRGPAVGSVLRASSVRAA